MMTYEFGPQYVDTTPSGEKNFIFAVKRYFNVINANYKTKTKDSYYQDYTSLLFKYINKSKPIDTYTSEDIQEILSNLKKYSGKKLSTIEHTYPVLLYKPCFYFYEEFGDGDNPLWGSAYSSEDILKKGDLRVIKKSLSPEEEKTVVNYLLLNPKTEKGENCGLATSLSCSTRNNESCGVNFGDLLQLQAYPGRYVLRIVQTTMINSNKLKASGKTANAPRMIATISAFDNFIKKRMEYLQSILTFPIENEDGVFNSVLDLPIACKGTNYTKRCNSSNLSKAGRELFRDVLHMREQDVASIDADRLAAIDDDVIEADPTTYLFRRNMASHCFGLGLTPVERQYYMGHKIEDRRYRRCDFMDEDYLYAISKKLDNCSINKYYYDANDNSTD